MLNAHRFVFINSLLVFISAFILTTLLHELGHFFSYLIFGAHPTLYHNFVSTPGDGLRNFVQITSALAGPFVSLFQGILFAVIVAKIHENSVRFLLFLWMSLLGFINFFGYLMLTPLSTKGDTGKVAEILAVPYFYRIFIAVIGLGTIIFIVLKMGKYFANFIPRETQAPEKSKYVNSLILFPIIVGSLINALLAFPIPVFLSVLYPLTSSYVVLSSYGVILKTENRLPEKSNLENKISVSLLILILFCIAINRLLVFGLGS
ncbi:MAG: hypothetical protein DWQ05_07870 [Calditrichaeota bacterium]|nr:MAG: hypothetical protein DWQ05_07870 [Calditrichota bacterium]